MVDKPDEQDISETHISVNKWWRACGVGLAVITNVIIRSDGSAASSGC